VNTYLIAYMHFTLQIANIHIVKKKKQKKKILKSTSKSSMAEL